MSAFTISLLELFIKGIPEGFLFTWAIYIFTKTPIDRKKYVLLSLLSAVTTYAIRRLPINYGVNTMISLLVMIVLFYLICKVDVKKVIISIIAITILLFVSEELNILLLTSILGTEQTIEILTSAINKVFFGIPSTIFFAAIVFASDKYYKKKSEKQSQDSTFEK